MMSHILSKLPEAYDNIAENIEDLLDYKYNPINIKIINDKIFEKYEQMSMKLYKKNKRRRKNLLYKTPIQG